MDHFSTSSAARRSGFSLIEMMVAMTVLLIMLGIIFKITQRTADTWKNSTGKTEAFRDARGAYEAMTRTLSQATLNTYFDYVDASGQYRDSIASTFTPVDYARRSDLHFISGKNLLASSSVPHPTTHSVFFQAPLGHAGNASFKNLDSLLNACGFYVQYSTDLFRPDFFTASTVPDRHRFRLMQFTQPGESLSVFDSAITGNSPTWNSKNWFLNPLASDLAPGATPASISQLAENVVALVILPKYSKSDQVAIGTPLSSDYEYDSRNSSNRKTIHQLPPVVQVVMVIIDETSAIKLGNSAIPPDLGVSPLFQDSTKLADDLLVLEKNLGAITGNAANNKIPLRYEIFQSEVALRGAKWSNN